MCLVIARWNDRRGEMASDGRMVLQPPAPVIYPRVTTVSEDTFKVHRLTPSLIVGIIGWQHVTDALLATLRAELTDFSPDVVTAHAVKLKERYPGSAFQVCVAGVRDGRVCAAAWYDADPSTYLAPLYPANRRVLCLGDTDLANDARTLAQRGTSMQSIFDTLSERYQNINAIVNTEEISC